MADRRPGGCGRHRRRRPRWRRRPGRRAAPMPVRARRLPLSMRERSRRFVTRCDRRSTSCSTSASSCRRRPARRRGLQRRRRRLDGGERRAQVVRDRLQQHRAQPVGLLQRPAPNALLAQPGTRQGERDDAGERLQELLPVGAEAALAGVGDDEAKGRIDRGDGKRRGLAGLAQRHEPSGRSAGVAQEVASQLLGGVRLAGARDQLVGAGDRQQADAAQPERLAQLHQRAAQGHGGLGVLDELDGQGLEQRRVGRRRLASSCASRRRASRTPPVIATTR